MQHRWMQLIVLLVALGASVAALGAPDLVIEDLSIEPEHPVSGDVVVVAVRVMNVGEDATSFPFHVSANVDGDPLLSAIVPGGLGVDEGVWVEMEWIASVGIHMLTVIADEPFDRIDETRETNNSEVATLLVQLGPDESSLRDLRIAVAPFQDSSGSGFVNITEGVATAVASRLEEIGFRVVRPEEVQRVLQERGLDALSLPGLATASLLLGADLLVLGDVRQFSLSQRAFSLGVLSLSSASAEIGIEARIYSVEDQAILASVEAWQQEDGDTGFSIDLGWLLDWLRSTDNVCGGGLRTDREEYAWGQPVRIGFSNPGPGAWLDVEITSSIGEFVSWRGSEYIGAGECGEWEWDQHGLNGESVVPGVYSVRLRRDGTILDEVRFIIQSDGLSFSISEELTIGTEAFRNTLMGRAFSRGLNDLSAGLTESIKMAAEDVDRIAATAFRAEASASSVSREFSGTGMVLQQGRVAQLLPGGEIAINIGANRGVGVGDVFEVLEASNLIIDPATGDVLAFDEVDVKGEIVIYDVRYLASYAQSLSSFDIGIEIGDVVRRLGQ
ncbi:hypothetical protein JW848_04690 [Candidatus Bipolaricaulota bacterium]|nr:hypothetical protein [Candidatus Bipolaricaulota bacterium]